MKTTSSLVVQTRVMLFKGEVYRLSAGGCSLKVRSGQAWLTLDGRDVFLGRGETLDLAAGRDFGLISALGHTPLVLEVLGNTRPVSSRGKPAWGIAR